jgi:hypothetical protein
LLYLDKPYLMILKLIYVLFFAASNVIIYALIHKTGWVKRNLLITSVAVFTLVFLLHAVWGNNTILLPFHQFVGLTFFLAFPIIVYLWFNFLVLKMLTRLKQKGVNENFVNTATRGFSVFFLNGPIVMGFFMQCAIIFAIM